MYVIRMLGMSSKYSHHKQILWKYTVRLYGIIVYIIVGQVVALHLHRVIVKTLF